MQPMDPLHDILIPFGVNITSSVIYDFIKNRLNRGSATIEQVATDIHTQFPAVSIENAQIIAEKATSILAKNGDIDIKSSEIYSKDSVWMRSTPGTKVIFRDESVSKTASGSEVSVGQNGNITLANGGQINQKANGDIDITG